MTDLLYERTLSSGTVVRIRRTSAAGAAPVHAVLEVDRRAGAPRPDAKPGPLPTLAAAKADTEKGVLNDLLAVAMEDVEIARLMRDSGAR